MHNIFFHETRILVPENMSKKLVQWFQYEDALLAHPGCVRLFSYLRKRNFWYGMYDTILQVTNSCGRCDEAKKKKIVPRRLLHLPQRRFSNVHLDVHDLNALPKIEQKTCILSMIDVLTEHVVLAPMNSATWKSFQQTFVRQWILYFDS